MSKEIKIRDKALREKLIEEKVMTIELLSTTAYVKKNRRKFTDFAGMLSNGTIDYYDAIEVSGITKSTFNRTLQAAEKILQYIEENDLDIDDTEFVELIEIRNLVMRAKVCAQTKINKELQNRISSEGIWVKNEDTEEYAYEKRASVSELIKIAQHLDRSKVVNASNNINVNTQNNVSTSISSPVNIKIIDAEYVLKNMYQSQQDVFRRTNEEADLIEQQLENGDFDE